MSASEESKNSQNLLSVPPPSASSVRRVVAIRKITYPRPRASSALNSTQSFVLHTLNQKWHSTPHRSTRPGPRPLTERRTVKYPRTSVQQQTITDNCDVRGAPRSITSQTDGHYAMPRWWPQQLSSIFDRLLVEDLCSRMFHFSSYFFAAVRDWHQQASTTELSVWFKFKNAHGQCT